MRRDTHCTHMHTDRDVYILGPGLSPGAAVVAVISLMTEVHVIQCEQFASTMAAVVIVILVLIVSYCSFF